MGKLVQKIPGMEPVEHLQLMPRWTQNLLECESDPDSDADSTSHVSSSDDLSDVFDEEWSQRRLKVECYDCSQFFEATVPMKALASRSGHLAFIPTRCAS